MSYQQKHTSPRVDRSSLLSGSFFHAFFHVYFSCRMNTNKRQRGKGNAYTVYEALFVFRTGLNPDLFAASNNMNRPNWGSRTNVDLATGWSMLTMESISLRTGFQLIVLG